MRRALLSFLVSIAAVSGAFAQVTVAHASWPDRPVRFIVPFPAGGAVDFVARLIGQKLSARLGQQFFVENRPGASGTLGSNFVAKADPDGYTVGIGTTSTQILSVILSRRPLYDPVKSFAPVSMIGSSPYVLAVSSNVPAKNVAELIALAKAKPRAVRYATAGPTSLASLAGTLLEQSAGVELAAIPYKSSAESVIDLIAGRIEMQFGTLAPTLPFIRDKKIRALATTGAKRVAALPDIPTVAEAGLPGFEAALFLSILMPAKTPSQITSRLNGEINAILGLPDVQKVLLSEGFDAAPGSPEDLSVHMKQDLERWRAVVAKAGVELQ